MLLGTSFTVVWLAVTVLLAGCSHVLQIAHRYPEADMLVREQLVIYADFTLPRHHRLISELVALRHDIRTRLLLPASDEPIQVYLFRDADRFREFMSRRFPHVPERRAFFVETDTRLAVFAHWGDRIGEDLRHEVAHGYLHSVVSNIPLWLDEGLAEYFEVPRGHRGVHQSHLGLLWQRHTRFFWKPSLQRLERITDAERMGPLDYAEAWLVVHWLLETTPQRRQLLQNYLARLRLAGSSPPLRDYLESLDPDYESQLLAHLATLRQKYHDPSHPDTDSGSSDGSSENELPKQESEQPRAA